MHRVRRALLGAGAVDPSTNATATHTRSVPGVPNTTRSAIEEAASRKHSRKRPRRGHASRAPRGPCQLRPPIVRRIGKGAKAIVRPVGHNAWAPRPFLPATRPPASPMTRAGSTYADREACLPNMSIRARGAADGAGEGVLNCPHCPRWSPRCSRARWVQGRQRVRSRSANFLSWSGSGKVQRASSRLTRCGERHRWVSRRTRCLVCADRTWTMGARMRISKTSSPTARCGCGRIGPDLTCVRRAARAGAPCFSRLSSILCGLLSTEMQQMRHTRSVYYEEARGPCAGPCSYEGLRFWACWPRIGGGGFALHGGVGVGMETAQNDGKVRGRLAVRVRRGAEVHAELAWSIVLLQVGAQGITTGALCRKIRRDAQVYCSNFAMLTGMHAS
ncbi:hypothetical protein C8Q76DRAFT_23479 [Earliella scabrosa]|nr:hypothetical protein C8Q76DRAFT_23479 [Earliella scabrosa]